MRYDVHPLFVRYRLLERGWGEGGREGLRVWQAWEDVEGGRGAFGCGCGDEACDEKVVGYRGAEDVVLEEDDEVIRGEGKYDVGRCCVW